MLLISVSQQFVSRLLVYDTLPTDIWLTDIWPTMMFPCSNQINIHLIRWQNTTAVADAKVVYINTMLFAEIVAGLIKRIPDK